jgi:streptomycin 6-kinase
VKLPDDLDFWHDVPGGTAWLVDLPSRVEACAESWSLTVGQPLGGGAVAFVLAATREDGTPAVLKLSFPEDEESEFEADALVHWDGHGAARLLERDDTRRALLLERAFPGTPLWEVEDDEEATAIAAGVLGRLHLVPVAPAHPFRSLGDAAAEWAETIPADWRATGRAFAGRLVDVAVDACASLNVDPTDAVLLHQDFHGANVLRSGGDGWVVIDPKPLVGDPAFDAASLVRDRRWLLGGRDDAARIRRRLDLLAELTGLDRERMRLWGIVHALAWGVSGKGVLHDHVRSAELLAEA